jgi:hypothetical protein
MQIEFFLNISVGTALKGGLTDVGYKFGDLHVTFKSWTFHKGEAEREGKAVKFVFTLIIEVRQNVV